MTVCVGFACDNRKSLVLVADKMIDLGYIQTEPDINKIFPIHRDWWLMLAGDDIAPAFDIIAGLKKQLNTAKSLSCEDVIETAQAVYESRRANQADALYLTPRTWTRKQFRQEGRILLPDTLYSDLDARLSEHRLDIQLLIAGFDADGIGHVVTVDDQDKRGEPRRHDLPGFAAIGSSSSGAIYMMYFRKCSSSMKTREAVYYAVEGKYFAEFASGMGLRTDVKVLRPGRPPIELADEDVIDKVIMKICERHEPSSLTKRDRQLLNELPMDDIDTVDEVPTKKRTTKVDT